MSETFEKLFKDRDWYPLAELAIKQAFEAGQKSREKEIVEIIGENEGNISLLDIANDKEIGKKIGKLWVEQGDKMIIRNEFRAMLRDKIKSLSLTKESK